MQNKTFLSIHDRRHNLKSQIFVQNNKTLAEDLTWTFTGLRTTRTTLDFIITGQLVQDFSTDFSPWRRQLRGQNEK